MTTTHFSKFTSDSVGFVAVDDRVSKAGPYKTAKFCYDHETEDGVITHDLNFELPEIKMSYGLTLENGYNLKGRFDFPRDSQDASDCVSSVARSQTKGWVSKDDVDIEMDVGTCTATPKEDSVNVHVKPDSDSTVVGTSTEVMNVVGKSPDKKFLSVVYGGCDGFFEKLRKSLASLVYENKEKLELGDKTEEDILKLITDPVYIAKDKKSGKVLDRDPGVYFNVVYYSAKPADGDRPAMSERVARFEVPGMDDPLSLDILTTKAITCIPTVKVMYLTKAGKGLSMKMYITSAVVTDIDDIKRKEMKSATYNRFSQNPELVEKMRKKMEKIKLESPTPKEPAPVQPETQSQDPYVQTTPPTNSGTDDFNLEDMLNNTQPVLDDIDLDNTL